MLSYDQPLVLRAEVTQRETVQHEPRGGEGGAATEPAVPALTGVCSPRHFPHCCTHTKQDTRGIKRPRIGLLWSKKENKTRIPYPPLERKPKHFL